jgi:hypothetical protein
MEEVLVIYTKRHNMVFLLHYTKLHTKLCHLLDTQLLCKQVFQKKLQFIQLSNWLGSEKKLDK